MFTGEGDSRHYFRVAVTRVQFHEASVKRLWRRHFDEYPTRLKHGSHSAVEQLNALIRTRARWRSLIRR